MGGCGSHAGKESWLPSRSRGPTRSASEAFPEQHCSNSGLSSLGHCPSIRSSDHTLSTSLPTHFQLSCPLCLTRVQKAQHKSCCWAACRPAARLHGHHQGHCLPGRHAQGCLLRRGQRHLSRNEGLHPGPPRRTRCLSRAFVPCPYCCPGWLPRKESGLASELKS